MAHTHAEGPTRMKCSIRGCPGELEAKLIPYTVQRGDRIFVINHVPAEVCSVCGDTLFTPETVRRIQEIVAGRKEPTATVPVYEYA